MHPDLRLAGALPPLDAPHHMRATEWAMYREGVVVSSVPGEGSLLNVGLDKVRNVQQGMCKQRTPKMSNDSPCRDKSCTLFSLHICDTVGPVH